MPKTVKTTYTAINLETGEVYTGIDVPQGTFLHKRHGSKSCEKDGKQAADYRYRAGRVDVEPAYAGNGQSDADCTFNGRV